MTSEGKNESESESENGEWWWGMGMGSWDVGKKTRIPDLGWHLPMCVDRKPISSDNAIVQCYAWVFYDGNRICNTIHRL